MHSGPIPKCGDQSDGWRGLEIRKKVRDGCGCLGVAAEGAWVSGWLSTR